MQRAKPFDPTYWPLGPVDRYVGQQLRALRISRGETALSCATIMGLSRHQLYQIEGGKRHLQPAELIRISAHYHIEPLYFFAGFKAVPPQPFAPTSSPLDHRVLH